MFREKMANASGSPHFPPKFQQIKILANEDRISADHGGEETSAVYYGGATGAVPFMWESQPGTPKQKSSNTPLPPPLTPPPSHQLITSPRTNSSHKKNPKNSKFSNSILSRTPSKKVNASPSLSSSSSSSSLSSSCFVITSSSSTVGDELQGIGYDPRKTSTSSTTCFGRINGSLRKIRGYCYTIKSVKKVFLSIVGHAKT